MLLKCRCKVKTIHLLTSQDEVRFSSFYKHCRFAQKTMYRAFCPSEASIKVELNVVVFQDKSAQQTSALAEIKQSLQSQNICLDIQYSSTIHDREIRYSSITLIHCIMQKTHWRIMCLCCIYSFCFLRFNNGWIIKIGRGLDYFKKSKVPPKWNIHLWTIQKRTCYLCMFAQWIYHL